MKLKRRQLSTTQVAVETAEALRKVIVGTKGSTPKILIEKVRPRSAPLSPDCAPQPPDFNPRHPTPETLTQVRAVGRELMAAQPSELVNPLG